MLKQLLIFLFFYPALGAFSQSANTEKAVQSDFQDHARLDGSVTVLKIYPNPVTGNNITIESTASSLLELHLLNIAGKEVYSNNFNTPVQKYRIIFDNTPEGVYLLKVILTDKSVKTMKVLIRSQN